jgi:hypothetical protein
MYNSYLKICGSSHRVLAVIISIVTRAIVLMKYSYQLSY